MNLDRKYYSFCKEVGLMKENYSRDGALKSIKDSLSKEKSADPAFVEYVNKLTLTSPEVHFRACILYHYSAKIEYVKNGVINDTVISDIGTIGIADYLHITDYKGKGEYTTVTDISKVPYAYWNTDNLLTLEDMKKVLANTIEKKLPSGTQSFRSKDWDVSAYLVPVLSLEVKYNDKWYYLSFNLQNGYSHWEWPNNPALIQRGKKTKTVSNLIRLGAILLSVIGFLGSLSGRESFFALLIPIAVGALNIFLWKNTKKQGKYFENYFLKNPDKSMGSQLVPAILSAALGLLSMIIGLAG